MKKMKMTLALALAAQCSVFAGSELYKDAPASPEARTEDLLGRMTLE